MKASELREQWENEDFRDRCFLFEVADGEMSECNYFDIFAF